jgi:hypothetical protein
MKRRMMIFLVMNERKVMEVIKARMTKMMVIEWIMV